MAAIEIYTIGFTKHTAAAFFTLLKKAGIRRLLDTRLHNVSQLAGFSKRPDLEYFLQEILKAEYRYMTELAPTQAMLDAYKKEKGSWEAYRKRYLALMAERKIEQVLSPELFAAPTVLLCSEHTADTCHRRLIPEYLDQHWGNVKAVHL